LELLAAGNFPEFKRFRAQGGQTVWAWREPSEGLKDRFELAFICDGNNQDEHSNGEGVDRRIDDLFVLGPPYWDAAPLCGSCL
jgi:hypothetical protein